MPTLNIYVLIRGLEMLLRQFWLLEPSTAHYALVFNLTCHEFSVDRIQIYYNFEDTNNGVRR